MIAMARRRTRQETYSVGAYPADKARGGVILLRKPWQRAVFLSGLAGAVVVFLIANLFWR